MMSRGQKQFVYWLALAGGLGVAGIVGFAVSEAKMDCQHHTSLGGRAGGLIGARTYTVCYRR